LNCSENNTTVGKALEVVDAMKETPISQELFGEKRQKSVEPFCSLR